MKIRARKELKNLSKILEPKLEATLKERDDLGLFVPQEYDVHIAYYSSPGVAAEAALIDSGPVIYVNVLPLVINQFQGEDRKMLDEAKDYFDNVGDFLQVSYKNDILDYPKKTIREFEELLIQNQELKDYKDYFGESYDSHKQEAIRKAKPVRETLKNLLPKIEMAFERIDLSNILRHEMDHVSFYSSPLFLDHNSRKKHATELGKKWRIQRDKSSSKEYAQANMQVLEAMVEVKPLLEVRALFFSYVNPNEWNEANFEDVKKNVYEHFVGGYVEGAYPEAMVDPLISLAWSNEEMDRETSKYLFRTVDAQRGIRRASMYDVNPEKVNYDLAERILYKELQEWKNRFATNGKIAAEVIGTAYRDNPSRLREANRARTFQEFLELCRI